MHSAARQLARGCAKHARITLLALNSPRRAEDALMERMLDDMTDAIDDSPERDDARALAGRFLAQGPGPIVQMELRREARRTIKHIRLLNR
jgi:hypothetical protein